MVPASRIQDQIEPYAVEFERFDRAAGTAQPPWLRELRQRAFSSFSENGFPTTRDEAWRFTNVTPIARSAFVPAPAGAIEMTRARLDGLVPAIPGAVRLVLVNGRYAREISEVAAVPAGVTVRGLAEALAADPDGLAPHLGRVARFDRHAFGALNTAFLGDGIVVEIAAAQIVEEPIQIVYVSASADEPTVAHPRALVIAGEHSQSRIVETFVSLADGRHFTNSVSEFIVGPGAVVDHFRLELENRRAYHLGGTSARLARASVFSSFTGAFGGEIVRNDVVAVLDGEGADCTLNGVTIADGGALVDHHTEIDHATAHCTSHEVYKSILGGAARGVFNGKIRVRPDAQKTDARQTNKTLLLSDDAQVNTKPELQILANDVKCTHGATVGRLNEEQWFYLRARGIGREEARAMLITAFAGEVVTRIGPPGVREAVEGLLSSRLGRMDLGGAQS